MILEGVDYSESRPDPNCLYDNGKRFVVRYLWSGKTPPGPKLLQKTEADSLKAAGLEIVSNFESWTGRALEGYSAGVADAKLAVKNHLVAGGPPNAVIYVSVDIDTNSSQVDEISSYFRGWKETIGVDRVGIYGEYSIVKYAAEHNLAKWFWQTYGWSGGAWYTGNHIEQYRNHVSMCGGTLDYDRALKDNYGQWGETVALTDAEIKKITDGMAAQLKKLIPDQ